MLVAVGVGDQDVGGLDVAVHQPARVRRVEGVGDPRHHPRRAARRNPAALGDELLEARALHVAHGDVEPALVLARAVDRDDVRVLQARRDQRLAHEQLAEARVLGALGGDQLQRDLTAELGIGGAVHHPHAPGAGERLDDVAGHDGALLEGRPGRVGVRAPASAQDRARAHPAWIHLVRSFGITTSS